MSQQQQQQPRGHHTEIVQDLPEVELGPIPGLIEGRVVHYVLDDGRHKGQHRPAIIVRVQRKSDNLPYAGKWMHISYTVQLLVFVDGSNDVPAGQPPILWKSSVHYSETHEPGTWHWIEKA